MKKIKVVALLMCLSLLVGCGSSETPTPEPAEPVVEETTEVVEEPVAEETVEESVDESEIEIVNKCITARYATKEVFGANVLVYVKNNSDKVLCNVKFITTLYDENAEAITHVSCFIPYIIPGDTSACASPYELSLDDARKAKQIGVELESAQKYKDSEHKLPGLDAFDISEVTVEKPTDKSDFVVKGKITNNSELSFDYAYVLSVVLKDGEPLYSIDAPLSTTFNPHDTVLFDLPGTRQMKLDDSYDFEFYTTYLYDL